MQLKHFWYANKTTSIPTNWHYCSGIFSLLCLLFGVASNGLVIFVFLRNKSLRRPRNYYLINLALTDMGLLLSTSPMHVISSFKQRWIFGQIGCNFYSVCGGIFGLTSIATIASISLIRLAAISNPFSSFKLTSRFTLGCLICAWIYGSIWIVPPLFGWNRFILEGVGTSCTFDYISQDFWDQIFVLMLTIAGFLIPLSVILVSYTMILVRLSQRDPEILSEMTNIDHSNAHTSMVVMSQLNIVSDRQIRDGDTPITFYRSAYQNPSARNIHQTEARATRTSIYICGLFCVAWGPYALMIIISLFGFNYLVNAYTTTFLGLFAKLAACINPLIYAFSFHSFSEGIRSHCNHSSQSNEEQRHRLIQSRILFHKTMSSSTQSSF